MLLEPTEIINIQQKFLIVILTIIITRPTHASMETDAKR